MNQMRSLANGLLMATLCWTFLAGSLGAQQVPSPEDLDPPGAVSSGEVISMDFSAIALRQAIQFIIRGRDINLVTADPLTEEVTIKLVRVPWRQALESVLKAHGYSFVEEHGILRVLRVAGLQNSKDRRVPLLLRLRHTSAEAVRKVLTPLLSENGTIVVLGGENGQTLSVIDRPEFIEVVQELLPKLDSPPLNAESEVSVSEDGLMDIRLVNYPIEDLPGLLQQHLRSNVFVETALSGIIGVQLVRIPWQEALRLILARHGYAFRMEKDVIIIGKEEDFLTAMVTVEFKLRYANGWDLKPYLEKLLSEGGRISCYSPQPRTGFEFGSKITEKREQRDGEGLGKARFMSVTDRPEVIRLVSEHVHSLDIQPRQVEVDVKIIEIRHQQGQQRGIDWNTVFSLTGAGRPTTFPLSEAGGSFLPGEFPVPGAGLFTFGSLSAEEFTAVLRLIDQSSNAEVVSEPNITTLDNTEASILIGQKFPVTSETIDPQTAVRTVTLDYYEDIGVQLLVIPSISEGDRVHMVIHPAVSSVSDLIDNRFPVIDTREADTQVMLRSGDTAVIGGLLERSDQEEIRKVPLLGSLPLVGKLFSYSDRSKTVNELVIFVTPRIVRDEEQVQKTLLLSPERRQVLEDLRQTIEPLLER